MNDDKMFMWVLLIGVILTQGPLLWYILWRWWIVLDSASSNPMLERNKKCGK